MDQAGLSTVVLFRIKTSSFSGRALASALLCLFLFLALVSQAAAAEQQERDFKQSGIRFPGGFDLNTVGDLRGKIVSLSRPTGSGPVILTIETVWERYMVLTCPPWYWDEQKIKFLTGEEVRVTGSKSLGKDSNLYIVAQEIYFVAHGKIIALRDKAGTPLWGLHRNKTNSKNGNRGRIGGQR